MLQVKPVTLPVKAGPLTNGKLTPCQLTSLFCQGWGPLQVHPEAKRAYEAMFIICKNETGAQLSASSPGDAYRSLTAQENVFRQRYTETYVPVRNVLTDGRTWNGKRWYKRAGVAPVAVPGTSNHGYGLALDTAIWSGGKIIGITADPKVWAWVQANALSFGLSWESQSEPWHLRLTVGDNTAQRVLDIEAFFANLG